MRLLCQPRLCTLRKTISSVLKHQTDYLLVCLLHSAPREPAYRFYGLDDRRGTLQKGKYADIVIMNDDLDIPRVMVQEKFYDV